MRVIATVVALVFSWLPQGEAATIVGFTGPYARENWTLLGPGSLLSFNEEAFTIGRGGGGWGELAVTVVETSVVTFDWEVIPTFGPIGITPTPRAVAFAFERQSATLYPMAGGDEGTGTLHLIAGEHLYFGITSPSGHGKLVISNFRAESVPEPSAVGLLAAGLGGILGTRRHRRLCAYAYAKRAARLFVD